MSVPVRCRWATRVAQRAAAAGSNSTMGAIATTASIFARRVAARAGGGGQLDPRQQLRIDDGRDGGRLGSQATKDRRRRRGPPLQRDDRAGIYQETHHRPGGRSAAPTRSRSSANRESGVPARIHAARTSSREAGDRSGRGTIRATGSPFRSITKEPPPIQGKIAPKTQDLSPAEPATHTPPPPAEATSEAAPGGRGRLMSRHRSLQDPFSLGSCTTTWITPSRPFLP
jgi:hypothetical protein